MNSFLMVFLGGGLGSALRLGVYRLARQWLSSDFPWGTLAVNVIGGLGAGAVTAWILARSLGSEDVAVLFFMTGVLGGFTTFSAFSVDTLLLWQRGDQATALMYLVLSIFLSIGATAVGLLACRGFSPT